LTREEQNTRRVQEFVVFAFWAIGPPLWFFVEYLLYRTWACCSADVFEHLKYVQESSAKVWAGIVAVIGARVLKDFGPK
jgi:hypothetical protein